MARVINSVINGVVITKPVLDMINRIFESIEKVMKEVQQRGG